VFTPVCSGSTTTITFTATPNTSVNYTIGGVAQTPISVGASGTATLTTAALTINTTYALTNVAYSIAPTCSAAASGSALITVNAAPTVNAGSDQIVCASSPNATLAGSITGSITTGTWTTAGTGTFNNANALNAVYTPSATDITAGTVTLTLTSGDPPGPCNPVADQMVITINPAATANANVDQAVCASSPNVTLAGSVGGSATTGTWTTAGTGTFNNPNALNAIYTPSAAEITAGTVTLTLTSNDPAGPCVAATDQMIITINASATASANVDQTVCASSPNVTLAGSVGGGATTGTWTTAGTGTFNNATALNAVYTPSATDITAGTVTLTLTSNDPAGPCGAATDQMTITINPVATANANSDQAVCASSPNVTLAGSVGGGATTGTWTTAGTGTFNNATALNAVYTPSATDITAGTVTLTLTSNDPAGPCGAATDQMTITINPAPTVSAGPNLPICSDGTATMAGSFGGGATSATWTTSGSGTFSNNTPTAVYTPSAADINAGTVTLTYTTDDPAGPCSSVNASMTLTIKKAVVITTQPSNVSVCSSFPADLNVVAIGDIVSYQWYKGNPPTGTAVANSANISGAQSANLHFNQASLADDGSYYVVISGMAPCAPVTSQVRTLNVDQAINITTQPLSQSLCIGSNVTFTVVADANGESLTYQWRKNGVPISGQTTSTLTISNITSGDAGNYDVVITGPAGFSCSSVQSAVAVLTVNAFPTITGTLNVCIGSTTQLAGSGTPAASNAWVSGTPAVASVNSTGLVTGLIAGTSVITYTNNNGCSITATVTVNPLPTITGTLSVCIGATTQLIGSGTPAASNAWVSATPAVASVNSTGLVTGLIAGTSVITYTDNNGCSITATVTVNPLPTITGTLSVCIGSTTQLIGSGTPAASNAWVSGTPAVATVNSTGLVTGLIAGTSVITYTNNNGCSITATVTVNPLPTITGTLSVCIGATTQLAGSGTPAASNPWVSEHRLLLV
jgi:uncharacterized protein YjdB